jgi:hypothetical protein
VAERANDEILQLAGQGNLQALSVYLNRHLIPSGAHVKVKQKDEALHVLIVVMSESEHLGLIQSVQDLLVKLRPTHIKRIKVYTQVLGQKQATLRQQFALSGAAEPSPQPSVKAPTSYLGRVNGVPQAVPSRPGVPMAAPSGAKKISVKGTYAGKPSLVGSKKVNPSAASASVPERYSVAEFLAQANNIDDLRVLTHHPFFTGRCPSCGHVFPEDGSPPTYWDCPSCKWKDNLSPAAAVQKDLSKNDRQISFAETKRLGDYLVEAGLLTGAQVEVALADQMTTGLRFGEVLIRRGWVKEETIEYLMQKVILPERTGHQNATSYLESSRNLLKALFKVRPDAQVPNSSRPESSTVILDNLELQDLKEDDSSIDTQDSKPPEEPKATPFQSGKLANERETLILPDVELDELNAYLKGPYDRKKV